jgi:hypothetical protein
VGGDATLGNLRLSGVGLLSGSPGRAQDITLAAAGRVLVTGIRDSVATRRTPEANPYAGWIAPADAAEPVITLTPGADHGQLQGRTVRIRADQGDIQLTGLRLAAGTDILAHSGGDTVIDSSQLTAGRDLSIHALGELRIDGLVANPEMAPPMADTLNGHAIPTSAQATLTAGRDMSLTGVEGVTARGFALQGRDIAVRPLGARDLAGGHLRESWSGRNDQHERDTAVAGRIQGRSLTLQALGEARNLASIFCIITGLIGLMRLLQALRLLDLCNAALRPVLRLMGIGPRAATIAVVGLVLGLAYGGGRIIHEARTGQVEGRDVFAALTLMGLCHSLIEDTLLMSLVGGHVSGILWGRLLFSLVVTALLTRGVGRLSGQTARRFLWTPAT